MRYGENKNLDFKNVNIFYPYEALENKCLM